MAAGVFTADDLQIQTQVDSLVSLVDQEMTAMKLEKAFDHVIEIARAANVYFANNEPWKLVNKSGVQGTYCTVT